ncbi:MAG TPA: molecular chaperone DnaJ [Actinomycetota bacterium]|nr:molecular chaperone DnaJ [Actinomycetota bacterium]
MADPYAMLGVSRSASPEEIKKAYRRLARQYHPDTSAEPDAETRFKQINAAYEVLSDPERRQRYDMFGDDGSRAASAGSGAGANAGFGDLGDLFESFFGGGGFGGGGRRRGPRSVAERGADIETTVRLTIDEAVFGVKHELEVFAALACEVCHGAGVQEGTGHVRCGTCEGTGEIRQMQRSIFGAMMTARACGRCRGTGQVPEAPCPSCAGEGRMMRSMMVTVDIPAGVEHGTTLRVRGRGEAGVRGGPPGDLYVHIGVEPNETYHRKGDDLLCALRVPLTQALLGATVSVTTLEGEEEPIELEPGTQPGAVYRIKGRGVPKLGGRGRGDLVIEIDVEIPRKLSGEQRDLVRRLAELRGELVAEKPRKRGFLR